jgi:hypothetical protein
MATDFRAGFATIFLFPPSVAGQSAFSGGNGAPGL